VLRRIGAAVSTAAIVILFTATGATADHWGAGAWHTNPDARCEDLTIRSECTPEDEVVLFYFDGDIPSLVKYTWNSYFGATYDHLPSYGAAERTTLNSAIDVRVRTYDIPDGKSFWVYTTCADGSTKMGSGRYESCKRLLQRVDPTQDKYQMCMDSAFCRNWYACHEIGHTFGLQHPGTDPDEHVSWNTCMDYDDEGEGGVLGLHSSDIHHLTYCFPKPVPPSGPLTPSCSSHT